MKTGLYWKQYELLFLNQFNTNRSHHIFYNFNLISLDFIDNLHYQWNQHQLNLFFNRFSRFHNFFIFLLSLRIFN